jgi:hypothetical protein
MDSPTVVPSGTGMALPDQSQQQNTASQGLGIINSLTQQKDLSDKRMIDLMHQATTPVPGSAVTSPQLTLQNQDRFQTQPLIRRETVGSTNTKRKGIANLIIAASNIAGKYEQKNKDEQQRNLAIDIERIYQSIDGIQQAKDTLSQDPNNADAKAAIKKNQGIIDAMMSDPKKRKQISKAFDINFLDPSKNNKPEHGAMQQATKSYSEQLQEKLPTQMQPNQAAQRNLAIETERNRQLSDNLNQAQRVAELRTTNEIKGILAGEKVRHDEAQEGTAQERLSQQMQLKREDMQNKWNIAINSANTRIRAASIAASAHIQAVQMEIDGRMAALHEIQASPITTFKVLGQNLQSLQKLDQSYSDMLYKTKVLLQQKVISQDDYDKKIAAINASHENTQLQINQIQSQMDVIRGAMSDSEEGSKDGNSNSTKSPESSTPKPAKKSKDTSSNKIYYDGSAGELYKHATAPGGAGDSDTH